MKAKIKDFIITHDRKEYITFEVTKGSFKGEYDCLKDKDIRLEPKEWKERRSLDANAYCWVLIGKLAEKTGIDRTTIYQTLIKDIGGNYDTVCVPDKAVDRLVSGWEHNGIGWLTDTFKSKLEGCTNVLLYYGSSTYDTKQMTRLIDLIVQECKEQSIDTATPEELARYKEEWK